MRLVPTKAIKNTFPIQWELENGWNPSEHKIYIALVDKELSIVKRCWNDRGEEQFKLFDLTEQFTGVSGGRVFNNSNDLKEFLGAVVSQRIDVYEFENWTEVLNDKII